MVSIHIAPKSIVEYYQSNGCNDYEIFYRICYLDIRFNQLQTLPIEMGNLYRLGGSGCLDTEFSSLSLAGNPLLFPPEEITVEGTLAILDYLRNEAWWHLQRLIAGAAAIGLVVATVLGIRWWNRRGKQWGKAKKAVFMKKLRFIILILLFTGFVVIRYTCPNNKRRFSLYISARLSRADERQSR